MTKKELGQIVNDLAERYPKVRSRSTLDALKAAGFHWATRSGITIAIDDVVTPPKQGRDPRPLREGRGEDREAVPARRDHRRGAPSGARRGLDQGDQRGRQGDGSQLPEDQPGLHHGQLGCPRKHDADAADRRHARPGGQPEGRDHPAPDQGQLPRGPVRAGVLHLHPRCPQGSGRHGAADRRLGLPDPAAGRRRPGRDHPRGGLRHRPRRRRCRSRPRPPTARWSRTSHVETCVYARVLAEDVKVGTRPSPRPVPGPRRRADRRAGRAPASPRSGCAPCSPASRRWAPAPPATAARWRPASWSTSARRSASSPPSPSASPAPS